VAYFLFNLPVYKSVNDRYCVVDYYASISQPEIRGSLGFRRTRLGVPREIVEYLHKNSLIASKVSNIP